MSSRGREAAALALLLVLGLAPRLLFIAAFPTEQISDFKSLVAFAQAFQADGWAPRTAFWDYFGPGLAFTLSLILRVVPGDPSAIARAATAVVCGLVPLLPFLIWRGVLPLRFRCLAAGMLAIWPGQVGFSGVVAQDNWVLPPVVALACLAARTLLARDVGRPVLAGLLFALAVAVRQEMLVALLPLLPAAAGLGWPETRRARNAGLVLLATLVPLLLLAAQRQAATGRFALTTEHGGLAVLGSYLPGSTVNGWADPVAYVASVEPGLLDSADRLRHEAGRLARREALRRPAFHAARIAVTSLALAFEGEWNNLYWALVSPDALPAGLLARGQRFAAQVGPFLRREMAVLQALFLASAILAVAWRHRPMLTLCAALLLKACIHAVTVAQGRYLLAVMALEILVIALAAAEVARRRQFRLPAAVLGFAAVCVAVLLNITPLAVAGIRDHDVDPQRVYRFRLAGPDGAALACVVRQGRLTLLTGQRATVELLARDPAPGDAAVADCELAGAPAVPLALRIQDSYAAGGLPGRIRQRVEVDGVTALDHDLGAEPWEGWSAATLAPGARRVVIQVLAGNPDPAAAWGRAATTTFELAASPAPTTP